MSTKGSNYSLNSGDFYLPDGSVVNIAELLNDVVVNTNNLNNVSKDANLQIENVDAKSTNPVPVYSNSSQVSDTFTRPNNTDIYAIGDVCGTNPGTNLLFSSVSNIAGSGFFIVGANLEIDVAAIPAGMGAFRLHLYNAAPTAIADNAAFNLIEADRTKYLGYIDIAAAIDLGETLWSQNDNLNFKSKLAASSTALYGVLETRTAYTPTANAVKKVILKVVAI
jgi:hypothetical protein